MDDICKLRTKIKNWEKEYHGKFGKMPTKSDIDSNSIKHEYKKYHDLKKTTYNYWTRFRVEPKKEDNVELKLNRKLVKVPSMTLNKSKVIQGKNNTILANKYTKLEKIVIPDEYVHVKCKDIDENYNSEEDKSLNQDVNNSNQDVAEPTNLSILPTVDKFKKCTFKSIENSEIPEKSKLPQKHGRTKLPNQLKTRKNLNQRQKSYNDNFVKLSMKKSFFKKGSKFKSKWKKYKSKKSYVCFNCNQKGHWANQCLSNVNLTDVSNLLLKGCCGINDDFNNKILNHPKTLQIVMNHVLKGKSIQIIYPKFLQILSCLNQINEIFKEKYDKSVSLVLFNKFDETIFKNEKILMKKYGIVIFSKESICIENLKDSQNSTETNVPNNENSQISFIFVSVALIYQFISSTVKNLQFFQNLQNLNICEKGLINISTIVVMNSNFLSLGNLGKDFNFNYLQAVKNFVKLVENPNLIFYDYEGVDCSKDLSKTFDCSVDFVPQDLNIDEFQNNNLQIVPHVVSSVDESLLKYLRTCMDKNENTHFLVICKNSSVDKLHESISSFVYHKNMSVVSKYSRFNSNLNAKDVSKFFGRDDTIKLLIVEKLFFIENSLFIESLFQENLNLNQVIFVDLPNCFEWIFKFCYKLFQSNECTDWNIFLNIKSLYSLNSQINSDFVDIATIKIIYEKICNSNGYKFFSCYELQNLLDANESVFQKLMQSIHETTLIDVLGFYDNTCCISFYKGSINELKNQSSIIKAISNYTDVVENNFEFELCKAANILKISFFELFTNLKTLQSDIPHFLEVQGLMKFTNKSCIFKKTLDNNTLNYVQCYKNYKKMININLQRNKDIFTYITTKQSFTGCNFYQFLNTFEIEVPMSHAIDGQVKKEIERTLIKFFDQYPQDVYQFSPLTICKILNGVQVTSQIWSKCTLWKEFENLNFQTLFNVIKDFILINH
ncbi:hypothetical protein A3Q56_05055 [Intoshia linei]|uniref:CCHC-type domain-containing protein n=1 Tax=Intoshia linei TaxID=1819745 RepID=A0A177AZ17_9BILA|nr:hypothetical protein A3Q56_05055 [Intoshia linei]